MTRTDAVLRFAQKMIDNELAHHQEHRPEALAALPATELDGYKKGERIKAYSLADEIEDKSLCFLRHQRSGFDTHNTATRSLFFGITGIALPSTNRETDAVVRAYCGAETVARIEAQQKNERNAADTAKRLETQRKIDARKATLSAKVAANESIPGDDLAELCGMLGIELHPRTVGMLRKRVRSINANSASIVGKGLSNAAYHAYMNCATAIEKQSA